MTRLRRTLAALLLLGAVSYGLSFVALGPAGLPVAMAIAAAKVFCVGWVFMELGDEGRGMPRIVSILAPLFVLLLLALVTLDVALR